MELDKTIKKRKSVKRFSDKKVDWRNIIKAIDLSRYAPMAGNLFSLKFIIVDDQEKIEQLAKSSQQQFIKDVEYVVVACTNPSKTSHMFSERGDNYLKQQAGAGIQNFLLGLNERGLSTCWIGHFVDEEIKLALSIPDNIQVEALFPIGYESNVGKTKLKNKTRLDNVLYFNKYGKKRMKK